MAMLAFFVVTEGRSLETFKALSASAKENQEQRLERLKEAFSQLRVSRRGLVRTQVIQIRKWKRQQMTL